MQKLFKLFTILIGVIVVSCQNSGTPTFNASTRDDKIRVALFNGSGASEICVLETFESLKIDTGISTTMVSAGEISTGELNKYDVVIFPGGSASQQLNNLGETAAGKVVEYVKSGHGAIGICAGGYLFSTTKDYPSLRLVSATEWDREHYDKGRALVRFELTSSGDSIFPELKNKPSYLQYYDGPVLMPADSNQNSIFEYTECARFVTDIQIHKGYPSGVTPGKTFLLTENIGKGKAIVVAGHPESTQGMRWMIARMVRYVDDKPLVGYNKKWIRPEIYSHEILFKPELVKTEKELFWKLLENKTNVKLEAMQTLYDLHSRPAVRWNMGLLRDFAPEVRAKAAQLLKQAEYSAALPDLLAAQKTETDSVTRNAITEAINFLSEY
jgi:putative intracellular protease/amidase